MDSRSMLETFLEALPRRIKAHDADSPKGLTEISLSIDFLKGHPDGFLSILDENQMSYLCLALSLGRKKVAQLFLNEQENDHALLSKKDIKGRSLIWHAAAQGFAKASAEFDQPRIGILPRLIMLIQKKQVEGQPGYKLWLDADNDGNTPLHIAAQNAKSDCVNILLTELRKEDKALFDDLLNQANNNGQTALHLALAQEADDIAATLINADASLLVLDNNKQIPFALFANLSKAHQYSIYHQLSQDKRQIICDLYHERLIANPELALTEAKQIYMSFSGILGLSALIKARLEFDTSMPLIEDFLISVQGQTLLYVIKAPNYLNLLHAEFPNWDIFPPAALKDAAKKKGLKSLAAPQISEAERPNYLRVNEDAIRLLELVADIDSHLHSIGPMPMERSLTIRFIFFMINSAVLLGLGLWTLISWIQAENSNEIAIDDVTYGMFTIMIFIALPSIATCICCIERDSNTNWIFDSKEKKIPHSNWDIMADRIQSEVIEPLLTVEQQYQANAAPQMQMATAAQNIRDLEECKAAIRVDLYRSDLNRFFSVIKNKITTVREDLTQKQVPLPRVPKQTGHIVIELGPMIDASEPIHTTESDALLGAKRLGYGAV